jgi:hypothetical protein
VLSPISSTSSNKQPLLIDRPLIETERVTTQIVGSQASNTLFVQGGQQPALLVDMDATLTDDTNNGGVIDSIHLVRETFFPTPDYTLNATTSGIQVTLTPGTQVLVDDLTQLDSGNAPSGRGYYTYTGAPGSYTEDISDINYTVGTVTGFTFAAIDSTDLKPITLAFYHTRGTTNPIPASGDYRVIFATTVPAATKQIDCTSEMPHLATPVPAVGNASDISAGEPVRNRGIYLEKGDRLYVGVFPANTWTSGTPAQGGIVVTAQGGFY